MFIFSQQHPDSRSSRPWEIIKDAILENFLPVYIKSMLIRKKIPLLIDAYAGEGIYEDGSYGSPIIMLNTAYNIFKLTGKLTELNKVYFLFMEKEYDYFDSLQLNISNFMNSHQEIGNEQIITFQGNSQEELSKIADFIQKEAPLLSPFLYLDPWGLRGVGSDLIINFLELRNWGIEAEILLRFPPGDVYRFYRNSRLGEEWIRQVLGDIELQELDVDRGERNIEILRRYVNVIRTKYQKSYGRDLYYVAVEVEGKPPYFMVFFSEHHYGCFVMGNSMINGLRKYLEIYFPLLGAEALKPFEANEEIIMRFITKFKGQRQSSEPITIAELFANYNRESLFPVLFRQPRGTRLQTIQHVIMKLKQDGVIQNIQGRVSDEHSLVYLS